MKHNYYDVKRGNDEWVGNIWKIGKYWLASATTSGSLGGFKSKSKAYAAILRTLK